MLPEPKLTLTVIIPVYNEFPWLQAVWKQLHSAPYEQCHDIKSVEFIFINDASTDESREFIDGLPKSGQLSPSDLAYKITVIHHATRQGKGRCLRDGIHSATGEVIVVHDADLEYSAQEIPNLVNPITLNEADAVFGNRFVGPRRRVRYYWNQIANHLLCFLNNILHNMNFGDITTGAKCLRGSIAKNLKLTSDNFSIEVEIAARLSRCRARIFEVPVSYRGRAVYDGKKFTFFDALMLFLSTFKFGIFDREAFRPGLNQTLNALDTFGNIIYAPILKKSLKIAHASNPSKQGPLNILEIGSGTGTLTRELFSEGRVVATDISEGFLEILQHRFEQRSDIEICHWDASQPFPHKQRTFDLIVCFNVLEHIEDDKAALRLWHSLLNPSGHLIVLVPSFQALYCPIDKVAGHYRRYSANELKQKMAGAGFKISGSFFGNVLGLAGWIVSGVILKRAELSSGQVRLFAILKFLTWPLEYLLSNFIGLSVIAVGTPASVPAKPLLREQ